MAAARASTSRTRPIRLSDIDETDDLTSDLIFNHRLLANNMTRTRTSALCLLLFPAFAGTFWLSSFEPVCAQQKQCGCEDSGKCKPGPTVTPSGSPTPKKSPLPPIVIPPKRNVFPASQVPPVNNSDLPGLDDQSGMATDTVENYETGRKNDFDHCDPCGTSPSVQRQVSKQGSYQERRRYIYNTYLLGKSSIGKSDGITQDQFNKLVGILKSKLEETNNQEKEAYTTEILAVEEERRQNLWEADKQVESRSAELEKELADPKVALESLEDKVEQVSRESLAVEREHQLLGGSALVGVGQARVSSLLEALRKRLAKDCADGKKLSSRGVLAVERISALLGSSDAGSLMGSCGSYTAIAKRSLPGFDFVAKKCVARGTEGRARFEGEWIFSVEGPFPLQGTATVKADHSGNWNGKASLGDDSGKVEFSSNGPADVISEGGLCLLWLKPGESTGSGQSEQFSRVMQMMPITGKFEIELLDQVCN